MMNGANNGTQSGRIIEGPSNPYYLHFSETPGQKICTETLTPDNYYEWKRSMIGALRIKNKLGFINGNISKPDESDPLFNDWDRCNYMVLSWITSSLSPEISKITLFSDYASEVWEELGKRFAKTDSNRTYLLKQKLHNVCQGNKKDPPAYFPRILGHEAVGVIESVGEGISEFAEGDMVIPIFLPDCAECSDCKSKKSNLCSKYPFKVSPWLHDGTSRFTDLNGETLYHFLFVSSFVEYTVVDVANVTKFDSAIPPNRACLLSCGVPTGVGAAWRSANVEAGSTVAIFGLGSIGLAVAEGARVCGAARIIGIDVNPDKFETAKAFGVTDFVNSRTCGDKSVSQVITEMTDGGADYCFECVGIASLVQEAYACCRKGWGKTIVLGVDKPGSKLSFTSFEVLHHGKTLLGSLFGGLKPKSDIPILIKRYLDMELELDKFVTHEVSFNDINKAFDLLREGKSLRCVIWMDI